MSKQKTLKNKKIKGGAGAVTQKAPTGAATVSLAGGAEPVAVDAEKEKEEKEEK